MLGRWRELDASVIREIEATLEATESCGGMSFNIPPNYSGRCEIGDACRRIVADWAAGRQVIDLLFDLAGRHGATLLLITHDPALAARCGRGVEMLDGRVRDASRPVNG